MMMLALKEIIDQLAIANSVLCYGDVLRSYCDLVLRRALDFEVEGDKMNGRLKRTWKRLVEEECVKAGLRRALDFEVEGDKMNGRLKRTWKRLVEEECVKAGLRREDAL